MSHDMNYNEGLSRYSGMYVGEPAWHNLGITVEGAQTWTDTIELAGMNWTVSKHQLWMPDNIPGFADTPLVDAHGIFRDDTSQFLGTVGNSYVPVQNDYAGQFIDAVLENLGGAHYETAGVLGKGERIWVMAKIPKDFKVGGTDPHETYLLVAMAHDGSMAVTAKLTTVRVVCNNTLQSALRMNGATVKIKHTKNAEEKLERAKKMIGNVNKGVVDLEEKFNLLNERVLDKETYLSILDRVFPTSKVDEDGKAISSSRRDNVLLEVTKLFEENDGNEFPEQRGTAFNVYNAITNYTDHYRPTRITASRSHYVEDQARAESAIFGSGATVKLSALEAIIEETENCRLRAKKTISLPPAPPAPSILDGIIDATKNGISPN